MENWNHVCFKCRVSVRRSPILAGGVRCPTCGGPCIAIGCEIPVPPKSRSREWRELENWFVKYPHCFDVDLSNRRKYFLQKRIAELSQYPQTAARVAELQDLQRELDVIEEQR